MSRAFPSVDSTPAAFCPNESLLKVQLCLDGVTSSPRDGGGSEGEWSWDKQPHMVWGQIMSPKKGSEEDRTEINTQITH